MIYKPVDLAISPLGTYLTGVCTINVEMFARMLIAEIFVISRTVNNLNISK